MSKLLEKLNEKRRAGEYATSWKPSPGDTLEGVYERTQTAETRYGRQDVSHVRAGDGTLWAVWHSHTVFREQWAEASPEPGDRVGVLYEGSRDGGQHTYHMYHVAVERAEEAATETEATPEGKDTAEESAAEEPQESAQPTADKPPSKPKVKPNGSFDFDAVSPGLPY